MIEFPIMQPFKNVSIKMGIATNNGIGHVKPTDSFLGVDKDLRFQAVTLDSTTGLGKIAKATDSIIGVLTESFNKAGVETQVMYSGIVPMLVATSEALNAGCLVQVHESKPGIKQYASAPVQTPPHKILGIVLVDSPATGATEPRYVPVLVNRYY